MESWLCNSHVLVLGLAPVGRFQKTASDRFPSPDLVYLLGYFASGKFQ